MFLGVDMLPDNSLSTLTDEANFLVPDSSPLLDFELGGVALNDTSQGLRFQTWSCIYEDGVVKAVSEVGDKFDIITVSGLTELSIAFDQNMRPTLVYVANETAYLYWFDTLIDNQTTTELGFGVTAPKISLDDSRPNQTVSSDIILAYIRDGSLCMRVQRDRYGVEYKLTPVESTTKLAQIGMSDVNRFQFKVLG